MFKYNAALCIFTKPLKITMRKNRLSDSDKHKRSKPETKNCFDNKQSKIETENCFDYDSPVGKAK